MYKSSTTEGARRKISVKRCYQHPRKHNAEIILNLQIKTGETPLVHTHIHTQELQNNKNQQIFLIDISQHQWSHPNSPLKRQKLIE